MQRLALQLCQWFLFPFLVSTLLFRKNQFNFLRPCTTQITATHNTTAYSKILRIKACATHAIQSRPRCPFILNLTTLQTCSRHLTDKLQLPFASTPSNAQSTLPTALSLGSTQDVLLEISLYIKLGFVVGGGEVVLLSLVR